MGDRRIVRAGLIVTVAAAVGLLGATPLWAGAPARSEASIVAKKKPKATTQQIKAVATALGLPKSVVKRGFKGLEKGDADQEQSGPNALPADPALDIQFFTSFAGADGETLFVLKLAAAPEAGDMDYEHGVGVAIDGQPQSTPNPSAIAGFGRVALSRSFIRESSGTILGLDPANKFAPVATAATAVVVDVFVVFRIPDTELGTGSYYLQAFGRQGATADSPAGFEIVMGEL